MKKMTIDERKKVSIEILDYIDNICRKNKIRYSLFGGTAIGAVRHSGFIPWDDDIDICLPFNDYKKLLNILRKQNTYNLLDPYSDDYNLFFAKLCDKRTTVKLDGFKYHEKNGVWVDIFPINNLGDTKEDCDKYIKKCTHNFRMFSSFGEKEKYFTSSIRLHQFLKVILMFPYKIYYSHDFLEKKTKALAFLELNNAKETKFVGCNVADGRYDIFRKEVFEHYTEIEFEKKKYKIVKLYDEYLTDRYGDYMTLPPKNERKIQHAGDYYWRDEK